MMDYDRLGPFYAARTPWRERLIVWPGRAFHTLPFPYLFQRWTVYADHYVVATGEQHAKSTLNGFFTRAAAERWIKEAQGYVVRPMDPAEEAAAFIELEKRRKEGS